jgi:hypothetical protein
VDTVLSTDTNVSVSVALSPLVWVCVRGAVSGSIRPNLGTSITTTSTGRGISDHHTDVATSAQHNGGDGGEKPNVGAYQTRHSHNDHDLGRWTSSVTTHDAENRCATAAFGGRR